MFTSVLAENLYKATRDAKTQGMLKLKSLPVLSHAHIYTHEGQIVIETCNLDEALRKTASARVSDDFDTCVPYKPFVDWLRISAKCKDLLELSYDPQIATLTVSICRQRSRAQFKCMNSQEFPPIERLLKGSA